MNAPNNPKRKGETDSNTAVQRVSTMAYIRTAAGHENDGPEGKNQSKEGGRSKTMGAFSTSHCTQVALPPMSANSETISRDRIRVARAGVRVLNVDSNGDVTTYVQTQPPDSARSLG